MRKRLWPICFKWNSVGKNTMSSHHVITPDPLHIAWYHALLLTSSNQFGPKVGQSIVAPNPPLETLEIPENEHVVFSYKWQLSLRSPPSSIFGAVVWGVRRFAAFLVAHQQGLRQKFRGFVLGCGKGLECCVGIRQGPRVKCQRVPFCLWVTIGSS